MRSSGCSHHGASTALPAPDTSCAIGGQYYLNGTLHGTTFSGGKNGDGIVFKILP